MTILTEEMSEHTKEPWEIQDPSPNCYAPRIFSGGALIALVSNSDMSQADKYNHARRIVACVNACSGIETDVLEQHSIGVISAEYSAQMFAVQKQRDELLAASQAREAKLRDALEESNALNVNWSTEADAEILAYYSEYRKVIAIGTEALSAPQDTAALEAMIAKAGEVMRERCMRVPDLLLDYQIDAVSALPGVTLEDLK